MFVDEWTHLDLDPEEMKALRGKLTREVERAQLEQLILWRSGDHVAVKLGLKMPRLTCAVCNKKTFLGPLCFDHMDAGRHMLRMWLDYKDPNRRNVSKIEDFLLSKALERDLGRADPLETSVGAARISTAAAAQEVRMDRTVQFSLDPIDFEDPLDYGKDYSEEGP